MELLPRIISTKVSTFAITLTRKNLKKFNLFVNPSQLNHFYYHFGFKLRPINVKTKRGCFRSKYSCNNNSNVCNSSNDEGGSSEIWEESEFVEVFGIGSRKDAILDYCASSTHISPVLRFWNIVMKDSSGVQLQQRYTPEALQERDVEVPTILRSDSKGVILVASAGYGTDHISAFDILRNVKAGSVLGFSIILKPFSFEGRKRQDEVKDLILELKQLSTFCIVIDTDALLEKDLVTLDESIKYSNKAVLMAINTVSSIISDNHSRLLIVSDDQTRALKVSEFIKILGRHKEGKIGCGSSDNMKTSILQAKRSCPFLGGNVQASDALIGCIRANPNVIDCCDVGEIIHTFCMTSDFKGQLILSLIPDPTMEPILVVTTVMAFSHGEITSMNTSQKTNIVSRLVERFPFMLRIMNKQKEQIRDPRKSISSEVNAVSSDQTEDTSFVNSTPESMESYLAMTQPLSVGDGGVFSVSDDGYDSDQTDIDFSEASSYESTSTLNQDGIPSFSRELLTRRNLGPNDEVTDDKDGTNDIEVGSVCTAVNVFNLPIGVKPSRQSKDYPGTSSMKQQSDPRMHDTKNSQSYATVNMMRDGAKATLGVVADLVKNGVKFENKISDSPSRRQGALAGRAVSMLEAERRSQKQLTRIVKMRYRGGTYKGHIQGGLPEGKGCLTLPDGSVYDGMWKYGKRSGLALFYFSNGDLYQGSWRDDLMHGKGWLYFQSGDRWFANFWKGEANGEGRFYSKDGDIFFGHFKDGWRNGDFLHVSVDGTRFREIWDEGILVSRMEMDPDASETGSG